MPAGMRLCATTGDLDTPEELQLIVSGDIQHTRTHRIPLWRSRRHTRPRIISWLLMFHRRHNPGTGTGVVPQS